MKSPFPGMDPYLESRWSDVHSKLIAFIGEALQPVLPPELRARSEEKVLVETSSDDDRYQRYEPDIAIIDSGRQHSPLAARAAEGVATLEPIVIDFPETNRIERSVQIIDVANGNQVVTAIEVLSPWNKAAGLLNRRYRKKVADYARGGVSLVEIDLLRSSRARLPVRRDDIPKDKRSTYVVSVHKAWEDSRWHVYAISLRLPLPAISVPLRRSDAEVLLPLQPLIDRCYVAGGHDDIDYRLPLDPPLTGIDAEWKAGLVNPKG